MRVLAFAVLLIGFLGSPAWCQNPGGPAGPVDQVTLGSPWCQSGETVAVSVGLETTAPISLFVMILDGVDPENLDPVYVEPGVALNNYMNVHGEPPQCDIIIYPDSVAVVIDFVVPFSSADFGTDWLRMDFDVTTVEPGPYVLVASAVTSNSASVATSIVTVSDAPRILRGDSNLDGSVQLADAIQVINSLFTAGAPLVCPDAVDLDDDGTITLGDGILLLQQLFGGSSVDHECDFDRTPDLLADCLWSSC